VCRCVVWEGSMVLAHTNVDVYGAAPVGELAIRRRGYRSYSAVAVGCLVAVIALAALVSVRGKNDQAIDLASGGDLLRQSAALSAKLEQLRKRVQADESESQKLDTLAAKEKFHGSLAREQASRDRNKLQLKVASDKRLGDEAAAAKARAADDRIKGLKLKGKARKEFGLAEAARTLQRQLQDKSQKMRATFLKAEGPLATADSDSVRDLKQYRKDTVQLADAEIRKQKDHERGGQGSLKALRSRVNSDRAKEKSDYGKETSLKGFAVKLAKAADYMKLAKKSARQESRARNLRDQAKDDAGSAAELMRQRTSELARRVKLLRRQRRTERSAERLEAKVQKELAQERSELAAFQQDKAASQRQKGAAKKLEKEVKKTERLMAAKHRMALAQLNRERKQTAELLSQDHTQ